jgi:hypothetical protein
LWGETIRKHNNKCQGEIAPENIHRGCRKRGVYAAIIS